MQTVVSVICSKSAPVLHRVSTSRDRITGSITQQTLVTISLGLRETACFSLDNGERYGISLDRIKSVLQYQNSYEFGIPKVEVKCVCDCPGAEDFCSSHTDSCKENDVSGLQGQCFNWFRKGLSNAGCTAFLSGSAEVCCSVHVFPYNTTIWRAVQLGVGTNRAAFSITNLNSHFTRTSEVDLEGGHPIVEPLYFTVSAPALPCPLKSGWYFGTTSGDRLYGGVQINSLSEYSLHKLGWYKYIDRSYRMDKTQVLGAFSAEVKNCDKDDLHVQFANKYTEQVVKQSAVPLSKLLRTSLSRVTRLDTQRRVEVLFRQYSNIDITVVLDGVFMVQKISDISHYTDFSGVVMMDKHSNYFVNVSLLEGEGSIRGNLTVNNNIENLDIFKINIDKYLPKRKVFYVRIHTICEATDKAILCLYTDSGMSRCKPTPCSREPLKTFELPDSLVEYERGQKMSILSLSTWAKHLNPVEWFNGLTNWKEGLIMVTEIVGVLTVLGLVFKVIRLAGCMGRCWTCICRRKRKKKGKRSDVVAEAERKESVDEALKRVQDEGGTVHYNRSYRSYSLDPTLSDSTLHYINLDRIHNPQMDDFTQPDILLNNPTLPATIPPFSASDTAKTQPCELDSILPSPRHNSTETLPCQVTTSRRIGRFGERRHTGLNNVLSRQQRAYLPKSVMSATSRQSEIFYHTPNRYGRIGAVVLNPPETSIGRGLGSCTSNQRDDCFVRAPVETH